MWVLESQDSGKLCWVCCGVNYLIRAASVAEMEPSIPERWNVPENHPEHVRSSPAKSDRRAWRLLRSGDVGCKRRDGAAAVKR